MDLIPIFAHPNTKEGLHSVHFDEEKYCEFDRLLEQWTDVEFITEYCKKNESYLCSSYFDNATVDDIIDRVENEATALYDFFDKFTDRSFENETCYLQQLFKPLDNREGHYYALQSSKFKHSNWKLFPDPILRLYAIRIGPNSYVITGGAIKFTYRMDEHPDTDKEDRKVKRVKDFLKHTLNIQEQEDLIYYYAFEQ